MKKRSTLVLIAAFCFYSGMQGVLYNSIGVLFAAILQDMQFRAGDLSVYYTIRAVVSALTLSFTVKLALSRNGRWYMALFGMLGGLSLASMSLYRSIWQWYISAVVAGFAIGCISTAIPVVINNWFQKKNGLLIGIIMSGAGISGMVFNPLFSRLVESFGWRGAALIVGLLQIVIVCIPAVLFYAPSPDLEKNRETAAVPAGKSISVEKESKRKEPAWVFFACFFAILIFLIQVNFSFQLGTYALSIGYSLAVGGTIASLSMIGNISGKFLLGYMADRVGIFRAMQTIIAGSLVSMVCFLFAESHVILMYTAGLCFGFLYSLMTTALPLLLKEIYGNERYVQKLKTTQSVNTFISAFASSLVAYIYDFTGNFRIVFIGFITMSIIAFGLLTLLKTKAKKAMEGCL